MFSLMLSTKISMGKNVWILTKEIRNPKVIVHLTKKGKMLKDINIQECKNYTCWLFFVYRPQILPKLCPNLPELARTCPNFAQTLPKLCPNFAQTLPKLCPNLPELCPNFARTLPELCPNLPEVSPNFAPKPELKIPLQNLIGYFPITPFQNAKFQPITL